MLKTANGIGVPSKSISNKKLRICTLMYHDLVTPGSDEVSGFSWPGSIPYRITPSDFEQQLSLIAKRGYSATRLVDEVIASGNCDREILLTFDDGGLSALTHVAEQMSSRKWVGHFFIATNYISTRGFLDPEGIRELHRLGHVVGSHMQSHPSLPDLRTHQDKCDEWNRSVELLEAILECPITVGSLPGGIYSEQDVEAAAQAGIETLFTSECRCGSWECCGVRCLGRFAVRKHMQPWYVNALAVGNPLIQAKEFSRWQVAGILRRNGGGAYGKFRNAILALRG